MAEVPETPPPSPQPAPQPAPQPQPQAPSQPHAHEPPPFEARESWNPFRTPFAYLVLLLQVGIVAYAAYGQVKIGGTWDRYDMWLYEHGWTADQAKVWSQPWRLFTSLVIEPMWIQVLMNVMIWWSAGPQLEKIYKTHRLAFLYVVAGLGCFFACDLLHYKWPDTFSVSQGRSTARHAILACSGSVLGLLLVVEGLVATLKSKMLWSQLGFIGLAFLFSHGLARGGAAVGLDVAGMLVDITGGAIFGAALGLTLMRGAKKVVGWLACAFLFAVVGVEGLIEGGRFYFSDAKAFSGQKSTTDGSKGGSISGSDPRRVPEEAATPKPALPEDDKDPPEIAKKRKQASDILSTFGPLPTPLGDPDEQKAVRKVRDSLVAFDERWTKSASANLEVEVAELSLACGDVSSAEKTALKAIDLLGDKLTPTKARGTVRGKRIARLYGVLAVCSLKNDDTIAAESQLKNAEEWDPSLQEVHFYRGRLASRGSAERKKHLELYLQGVGPESPSWQKERAAEAKSLLGVE
ncbi:MAG: rhomboid family intramembrane serine protease [Planctomycetota bacterium]